MGGNSAENTWKEYYLGKDAISRVKMEERVNNGDNMIMGK